MADARGGDHEISPRADLLVSESREELSVFKGIPGPELFEERPATVAVALPFGWQTDALCAPPWGSPMWRRLLDDDIGMPGGSTGKTLVAARNRNAFGHGGMWPSYRTDVMRLLDRGITVAVQANTDRSFDTEGLIDRIAALAD